MGRKLARMRELLGYKQLYIGDKLGISQQSISMLEQTEHVDEPMLKSYSKALGVSVDAIRNFSEDGVINYFNTFNDNQTVNAFNRVDIELVLKLTEENKQLYERLLKSEQEKIEFLKGKRDAKL